MLSNGKSFLTQSPRASDQISSEMIVHGRQRRCLGVSVPFSIRSESCQQTDSIGRAWSHFGHQPCRGILSSIYLRRFSTVESEWLITRLITPSFDTIMVSGVEIQTAQTVTLSGTHWWMMWGWLPKGMNRAYQCVFGSTGLLKSTICSLFEAKKDFFSSTDVILRIAKSEIMTMLLLCSWYPYYDYY